MSSSRKSTVAHILQSRILVYIHAENIKFHLLKCFILTKWLSFTTEEVWTSSFILDELYSMSWFFTTQQAFESATTFYEFSIMRMRHILCCISIIFDRYAQSVDCLWSSAFVISCLNWPYYSKCNCNFEHSHWDISLLGDIQVNIK